MYTIAAYFVHEELYISSLQNIIDNFLHYYFHREKQVQEEWKKAEKWLSPFWSSLEV